VRRAIVEEPEEGACSGNGREVAVKTFRPQTVREFGDAALSERFRREVATFQALGVSLQHLSPALPEPASPLGADPRLLFVNLLDFSREEDGGCSMSKSPGRAPDGCYYSVLELAEESLETYVHRRAGGPDLAAFREIATSLAAGLAWLHAHGLCHLDVKPANIMRFGRRWKLIDLEGCLPLSTGAALSSDCFTPVYACPELARVAVGASTAAAAGVKVSRATLSGVVPSAKMDVWSAGVVLLDVLAQRGVLEECMAGCMYCDMMDFDADARDDEPDARGLEQFYQWLADPAPLDFTLLLSEPASSAKLLAASPALQDLLAGLLVKDPDARLTAEAFRTHPFLAHDSARAAAAVEEPAATIAAGEPKALAESLSPAPAPTVKARNPPQAPRRKQSKGEETPGQNARRELPPPRKSARGQKGIAASVIAEFEKYDSGGVGTVGLGFFSIALQAVHPTATEAIVKTMLATSGAVRADGVAYREFFRWLWQAGAPPSQPRRRSRGRTHRQRRRQARMRLERGESPVGDATPSNDLQVVAEESAEESRRGLLRRVAKEGGKRGSEIEGAADLGGLQFFSTCVLEPDGDVDLLLASLQAMNAVVGGLTSSNSERLGGSGHVGKMVFSAGVGQLALAAFVPEARRGEVSCEEWLRAVLAPQGGEVLSVAADICTGRVKADATRGIFPLKIKEPMILESNSFLRARGLFPQVDDDDEDEILYGDDDFPL